MVPRLKEARRRLVEASRRLPAQATVCGTNEAPKQEAKALRVKEAKEKEKSTKQLCNGTVGTLMTPNYDPGRNGCDDSASPETSDITTSQLNMRPCFQQMMWW